MPANTPSSVRPLFFRRHLRWWIISGAIITGILIYGFTQPKEPGADWFAPIDRPKSKEWELASQPTKIWTPRTNDTMGVMYELEQLWQGERRIRITTTNLGTNAQGGTQESQGADYAELIRANIDNTATLPDGTVVRLSEVIAYPVGKAPPQFFKLANGIATPSATSITQPLHRDEEDLPCLQFALEQKPLKSVLNRKFDIYEASTGRLVCSGDGFKGMGLESYGVPYMPQSPLHLLLRCHYGGTQQFIIPATSGSFAENNGVVVRYCGNIMRKAEENIDFFVDFSSPQSVNLIGFGSRLGTRTKPDCIFIFTQALGSLEILSAEAILENGEKVSLYEADPGYSESFRAFCGPEKTVAPISSFVLTLPKHSARIAFVIPQIQELWPAQNVKNRFDLHLSAVEAAQFKHSASHLPSRYLLETTTGLNFSSKVNLESAGRLPYLFKDENLTDKTIREALVLYLQHNSDSAKSYTTALDSNGDLIFERKKPMGVYIWRWINRHPRLMRWVFDNNLHKWLSEIGIKPG